MSKKKQPPRDHLTIREGPATEAEMFALQAALVDELQARFDLKNRCPTCSTHGVNNATLDVIRKLLLNNRVVWDTSRRAAVKGGLQELRLLALPFSSKDTPDATDKETH